MGRPSVTALPKIITATAATRPATAPSRVFLGLICWEDDEDDPGEPLVAGEVEEEIAVHRQPDVEGAGHSHRPAVEAFAAAGDEEEGHQAADQRDREDELEGDAAQEGAAEGHVSAQWVEQPARRPQAHLARQPAELPEQESGED